ncbi:spore germination lipoprotein GerD [Paenibacillus xylaniclasticus]|uniref:spore germination lipoprotein GerD n=1 Tax=Paenibacillus xylaniclasticus TaxID=588083 RepID=UPI000FDACCF0|nr:MULTISPECIES: spore germination lipoprotein GerD [Paenibacillus]GFN33456.1 germination protein GerD [Paenibacillus curdlanolyticus]
MVIRWRLGQVGAALAAIITLTSCGAEPAPQNESMSYKDMKSMVIDILKTEDAQKAIQESTSQMSGGSGLNSKLLSVQDQEQVRMAVKEVLVSPEYDKVIKQLMTDPRFAGEFAKTVNSQNKQIHKDLLKDPAYQKDLISVLKSPEVDKMILEVLQGPEYRKTVMSLMQDAMQNPLFKLEVLNLLKKAVQEELKPSESGDKQSQSGGEGGGEGESSKESEGGGSEEEGSPL